MESQDVDDAKSIVKPALLDNPDIVEKFRLLHRKIRDHELMRKTESARPVFYSRPGVGTLTVTLDDIQEEINSYSPLLSEREPLASVTQTPSPSLHSPIEEDVRRTFIKIILRITEDFLLYEQNSIIALRHTEEGYLVEADNKRYHHLTQGEGSRRWKFDAVAQTTNLHIKSRGVNTEALRRQNVASHVSIYEMFDTYNNLEPSVKSLQLHAPQEKESNSFVSINVSPRFQLSLMLMTRVLAGSSFEQSQRRFRNMVMPDPLALDAQCRYHLKVLWSYCLQLTLPDQAVPAVSDMSWCHGNSDVLAVGYGIYTLGTLTTPKNGYVCIWNIKNPVNPERFCAYPGIPVTAVEFSPLAPQILAVGLCDGTVEVRDISDPDFPLVAKSQRSTSLSFEPVTAFRWMPEAKQSTGLGDEESSARLGLITLWRNGAVTKYRIISSPFLLGFPQLDIDRVDGFVEGLTVIRTNEEIQAHRQAQGLNLSLHPSHAGTYYVLTDDGCLHKCSTYQPQQHIEVLQVHEAAVNSMDFSPFCPKVFLTCGNDWCIRIWMDGICEPLITLRNNFEPVHCAYWSKTHATIVVAINRKTVDIWDIRRNTLKPVASHTINDRSYNTEFQFSNCGHSMAVGNEGGIVTMVAFEDMPFPLHYQIDGFRAAILGSVATNSTLVRKVKSLGFSDAAATRKEKKKSSVVSSKWNLLK